MFIGKVDAIVAAVIGLIASSSFAERSPVFP
jgi:hypothetical protein